MERYENYEEGKLYCPIASRTIWCVATHHQWYKTLLDVAIWDLLDPKQLLKTSWSDTTFVTSGEHPLEVTWRTWPLGGLIQAHSYHSSHCHSKFSGKFKTFHSTSYARTSLPLYIKYHNTQLNTLVSVFHPRLNIIRVY